MNCGFFDFSQRQHLVIIALHPTLSKELRLATQSQFRYPSSWNIILGVSARHPNKGSDIALGLAIITGLILFFPTVIACFLLAFEAGFIRLHLFERHPRISPVEYVAEFVCWILSLLLSWLIARVVFGYLRRR
jgi:hypothetical protein